MQLRTPFISIPVEPAAEEREMAEEMAYHREVDSSLGPPSETFSATTSLSRDAPARNLGWTMAPPSSAKIRILMVGAPAWPPALPPALHP